MRRYVESWNQVSSPSKPLKIKGHQFISGIDLEYLLESQGQKLT